MAVTRADCIYPDCLIAVEGWRGRYCEHSCPFEDAAKAKAVSNDEAIPYAGCYSLHLYCDMTPDEEFNALVQLARALEDDDEPLPTDIENYVVTLSGTAAIGVRVAVRRRTGGNT